MQASSPQVTAIITMLQTLPETAQNQVVEHLQEYLAVCYFAIFLGRVSQFTRLSFLGKDGECGKILEYY